MEYVIYFVLSVIAGVTAIWLVRAIRGRGRGVNAGPPPSSPRADEAVLTPQFLIGLFNDRTTAQAVPLTHEYVGKPMTATGAISDISRHGSEAWVSLRESSSRILILAIFDESWVERITVRRAGETITVTGSVATVAREGVTLKECRVQA